MPLPEFEGIGGACAGEHYFGQFLEIEELNRRSARKPNPIRLEVCNTRNRARKPGEAGEERRVEGMLVYFSTKYAGWCLLILRSKSPVGAFRGHRIPPCGQPVPATRRVTLPGRHTHSATRWKPSAGQCGGRRGGPRGCHR